MTTYKPSIFDLCPDIMGLVLDEVAKCKFNKVLDELTDPRFHKAAKRLYHSWRTEGVHPGRVLVSVTYPQQSSRYISSMSYFEGERINLYGIYVNTWHSDRYTIKHYTIADIKEKIAENGFKLPKGIRRKPQLIEFFCRLK